jgi:hypothetical protein
MDFLLRSCGKTLQINTIANIERFQKFFSRFLPKNLIVTYAKQHEMLPIIVRV